MMRRISLAAGAGCLFALAACAPSNDDETGQSPSLPAGFELASLKTNLETKLETEQSNADTGAKAAVYVSSIDPAAFARAIAAKNVRLIDVRTREEFAGGHIKGAENIPLDEISTLALDPADDREIMLYCRSDRRSGIASAQLYDALGYAPKHLSGGIIAWEKAGLPVELP